MDYSIAISVIALVVSFVATVFTITCMRVTVTQIAELAGKIELARRSDRKDSLRDLSVLWEDVPASRMCSEIIEL